ncbi:uncharacterized protein DC041_0009538, partial [Schistosoma bovis]
FPSYLLLALIQTLFTFILIQTLCSYRIRSDDFTEVPIKIIQFEHWLNPLFLLYFMFSCCSAVALNYTLVQCTQYTSALTTSILGVIKSNYFCVEKQSTVFKLSIVDV